MKDECSSPEECAEATGVDVETVIRISRTSLGAIEECPFHPGRFRISRELVGFREVN